MNKFAGKYKSKWDGSTWSMIALTGACCLLPLVFDDDGYLPIFVSTIVLLALIIILKSVYYRISGRDLIVYQFFIPAVYPIDMIEEISPIKTYLSAPATSLTDRIAIKFSDKSVMKSVMPLVISPKDKESFIRQLKSINPSIIVKE